MSASRRRYSTQRANRSHQQTARDSSVAESAVQNNARVAAATQPGNAEWRRADGQKQHGRYGRRVCAHTVRSARSPWRRRAIKAGVCRPRRWWPGCTAACAGVRTTLTLREFSSATGRRPRILISKMPQDGHDRGVNVVVSLIADLGFDVDVSSLFHTPAAVVRDVLDADVHLFACRVKVLRTARSSDMTH